MLHHLNQCFLYWVVDPSVYFDPHSFNYMVLKGNNIKQTDEQGLQIIHSLQAKWYTQMYIPVLMMTEDEVI